jgi:putative ATP-binding cassette transporter
MSLQIERGERVWLSGRSGSGKSTVLRVVAGLWPSGSGTVTVPQGSRLFVPQKPYMPYGTLKQCICYPCLPDEQTDKGVLEVLEMTGLLDVLPDLQVTDNWERRLSGGEKQRVGFARALLTRPDWLFMDEATANLDEEAEIHCHRLLDQYLPNATVISVLHRSAADQFYNRRISLAEGNIT